MKDVLFTKVTEPWAAVEALSLFRKKHGDTVIERREYVVYSGTIGDRPVQFAVWQGATRTTVCQMDVA